MPYKTSTQKKYGENQMKKNKVTKTSNKKTTKKKK